jgi:thiol-disulfide isomerase/thioredoxin
MILLKSFLFLIIAALSVPSSRACPLQVYSAEALQAAQKDNRMVVLHFFKVGCHTCHVQTAFLTALKFSPTCPQCKDVVFFEVDVDEKNNQDLMKKVDVAMPAVLVVLQGEQSLGRSIGQTDANALLLFINDATKLTFQV